MSMIKSGRVFLSSLIGLPLAALILPGIQVSSWGSVIVAAILLGLFWMIIRPILRLISFPLNFLTFGLLGVVVDTLLFQFVLNLSSGVYVGGFIWAFLAALIVGLIQGLLGGRDD